MAYSGTSTAWPNTHPVSFDLGAQFAGENVRIRFRIGSDAAVGMYGWEIDNLQFSGITNAPFEQLSVDVGQCPPAVIANAGEDQSVGPGDIVVLSGSGVSFENLPLTYSWAQTAGPTVEITRADTASPIFVAPVEEVESVVTIELTISDGVNTSTDSVDITVGPTTPAVVTADAGDDATVEPSSRVVLDGRGSTTDGTLPLTYSWAQLDGTTVTLDDPTSPVAQFTAPAPATNDVLTFELTVTDGLHTDTDTVEVTVNGYLLTANAGEDQIVEAGTLVILDGSGSTSSTNLPLTFAWSQTAGPEVTLEGATTAVARFTAPNVEEDTVLTFELSLGDGSLTSIATVDVTVQAGEVDANAGADQTVDPNTKVFLDGSGSTGKDLTYSWEQTAGPSVTLDNADGVAPSFTAGAPATATELTFELTVSDGTVSDTDTVKVRVRAVEEEDGGCGCSAAQPAEGSSALAMLGLLGLALVLRARRWRATR
jgi:MYXO-CTERM domain-containing protein